MNRFFVNEDAVKEDIIEITLQEDIKHISKVLRLKEGDKIDVSDSNCFEYITEILSITPTLITVKILDKQKFAREPKLRITLFQCIPKQSKIESVIQKSVELGVYNITPVFSDRTIVSEKNNLNRKLERWRKISAEAVKQCKRGLIPQVNNQLTFNEMLNILPEYDVVLIPYENEETISIKEVLRGLEEKPDKISIIIGPEGGFSDEEVMKVIELGGKSVTLGKTILRTETAGPTAIAMVMYELEL